MTGYEALRVRSAGNHTITGSNEFCHMSHFRKGLHALMLKQTNNPCSQAEPYDLNVTPNQAI